MHPGLQIIIILCGLFLAGAVLITLVPVFNTSTKHSVKVPWQVFGYELLIIAAVLLPAFLGAPWFLAVLLLFNLRAHWEIRSVQHREMQALLITSYLFSALLFLFNTFGILYTFTVQVLLLAYTGLAILLDSFLGLNSRRTIFLLLMLNMAVTSLLGIAAMDNGFLLILFLYLLTESNDSFAYISGKLLGKRKLFPVISPGKTLEGMLGGIFVSVFAGLVFNYYLVLAPWITISTIIFIIILSAIAGDLLFSIYKRGLAIKDFPAVIKYHGGILDIYDSFLFGSIVYYFLLQLLY